MKLAIDKSHTVIIDSALEWQDAEIEIEANQSYRFDASGRWVDFFIPTDADGFKGRLLMPKDENKIAPGFNWLALVGRLDSDPEKIFLLGTRNNINFNNSGTLKCIANDMKKGGFYRKNNWGKVTLTITRTK